MYQRLRRLFGLDTIDTLIQIGYGYKELVRDLNNIIDSKDRELQELRLEHTRAIRDLVEQFFIVQESGADVRDELEAGLRDLQDEVARQEEHTSTSR